MKNISFKVKKIMVSISFGKYTYYIFFALSNKCEKKISSEVE